MRVRHGLNPVRTVEQRPFRTQHRDGVALTCSALKRSYRDLLREASGVVRFVHVTGDPALVAERMRHRSGHFMPETLLPSQLQTLEPLGAGEDGLTLSNDSPPEDLADRALAALGLR